MASSSKRTANSIIGVVLMANCVFLSACGGGNSEIEATETGSTAAGSGSIPLSATNSGNSGSEKMSAQPSFAGSGNPAEQQSHLPSASFPASQTQRGYQISLFAGNSLAPGYADGAAQFARFTHIRSMTSDAAGNLYVADMGTIRKITPAGEVTTLAGAWQSYGHADGSGPVARFGANLQSGEADLKLAADEMGNVYVADAPYIRKVSPQGEVTTIAGAAETGTNDGTVETARFASKINGIAVDSKGNLFIDEGAYLNPLDRVRKIGSDGTVSTVHECGFPLSCGNIRADAEGNLYVQSNYVPQSAGDARSSRSNLIYQVTSAGNATRIKGVPGGNARYLSIDLADAGRDGSLYFYQGNLTIEDFYSFIPIRSEYSLQQLLPSGEKRAIAPFSYVLPDDQNASSITDEQAGSLPPLRRPPILVDYSGTIYFYGKTYIGRARPSSCQ